jgi:hypothetical protein
MSAAGSDTAATVRARGSVIPTDELRPMDRLVWTQVDGAVVYVTITRINFTQGIAYLRCHYGSKAWTRRHDLPLFPSMQRKQWTTADLLDQMHAKGSE